MWMKIFVCIIFVIILNCNRSIICGNVNPLIVHRVTPTGDDIKISKNITIFRNGYGRLLGLLKLLKGVHHKNHVYSPYVISRLWRASFEFELNPQPIFDKEISLGTYYPTHFGVSGGGGSSGGAGNSGLGSNNIESIFHFGNNEQQSSVTIGGSNQIVKGPDERDEIAPAIGNHQNEVVNKDAIDTVVSAPAVGAAEKSERVLRHAIQPRTDEESDEIENADIPITTPITEESETTQGETTTPSFTAPSIPQTTQSSEALPSEALPPEALPSEIQQSESTITGTPESSSPISNAEHVSSTPLPSSEWLGYYDSGIHKPEYIQNIEFTTNYPSQLVREDFHYVTYETPFKPSLPDYTNTYASNFFVPVPVRYFKRL